MGKNVGGGGGGCMVSGSSPWPIMVITFFMHETSYNNVIRSVYFPIICRRSSWTFIVEIKICDEMCRRFKKNHPALGVQDQYPSAEVLPLLGLSTFLYVPQKIHRNR